MNDDRVSQRQQEFIDFMQRYQEKYGSPPTYKEIAIGMGISSKGSVSAMMLSLEKMGYVRRAKGAYRGTYIRSPVQASPR